MRTRTVPMLLLGALVGSLLSWGGTAGAGQPGVQSADAVQGGKRPLVIGHRGAPGYRPEHTRGSYELAAKQGADWIEPDLVATKDHHLVARHENDISGTTDVADHPEFADRKTTKTIDGRQVTGWFTEDFTLKEIKTLRAKERLPDVRPDNTAYDGKYRLMTLQEVLDLAKRLSKKYHRKIGIVPETKHPTYFRDIDLPLEEPIIKTVKRNGLDRPDGPVVLQSFEPRSLQRFKADLTVPLMQNISMSGGPYGHDVTYDEMVTPAGLADISEYAGWIGVDKRRVISLNDDGTLGEPTALVQDAHAAEIRVTPYTFRNENQFLPVDLRIGDDPNAHGDAAKEYRIYADAGVDAMYSDFPDTALAALS